MRQALRLGLIFSMMVFCFVAETAAQQQPALSPVGVTPLINPPATSAKPASTQEVTAPTTPAPAPAPAADASQGGQLSIDDAILKARYSFNVTVLTIVIAGFMIVAFCFMYAIEKATPEFGRYYIVIVVVVSSIFLLVMGYDEKQVAPAFGLLGTILGYVFGRISSSAENAAEAHPGKPAQGGSAAPGGKPGQSATPPQGNEPVVDPQAKTVDPQAKPGETEAKPEEPKEPGSGT